jgi:hypothetical protein
LGLSVRVVKGALAELVKIANVLSVRRRNRRAAVEGERSNEYTLTVPDRKAKPRKLASSVPLPAMGARPSQDPVTPDLPDAERLANVKRLGEMLNDVTKGARRF